MWLQIESLLSSTDFILLSIHYIQPTKYFQKLRSSSILYDSFVSANKI